MKKLSFCSKFLRRRSPLAALCVLLAPLAGCQSSESPAASAAPRLLHPAVSVSAASAPAAPPPLDHPVAAPPSDPALESATPAPPAELDAPAAPQDAALDDLELREMDAGPSELAQRFNAEALREHDRDLRIIRRGNPDLPEVALTFDDGPHPEFLPRLLDKLRELNVHATFFVVGEKVADAPDMAARIVQDGHEIANHTFHHLNLTTIPLPFIESEIKSNNDMIYQACGVRPKFFRPPGGRADEDVYRIARDEKLTTVMWTDDPADFSSPGPEVIEGRLLGHIRPGAVILLHSGIEQTLAILPDFVAQLRRGGYRFVTMSEMAQHLEKNSRVATK